MCLEGRRETGREQLSLGTRERGWVQEGRAPRLAWGCCPSGFRQVEAPVCVPSLLRCQKGVTGCRGGGACLCLSHTNSLAAGI